jgi:regulator of protease activity HflC (stomatin/prohibitin superfamily)
LSQKQFIFSKLLNNTTYKQLEDHSNTMAKTSKKQSADNINLIDLIDNVHPDLQVNQDPSYNLKNKQGPIKTDFNTLKFIESPVEEMSNTRLPQTLKDCVGCLDGLPLRSPNADQSNPQTIVDMINTVMDLDYLYPNTNMETNDIKYVSGPNNVPKQTVHSAAFGAMGHTVRPGCISLYKKFETIYAVPEGRWWILDPLARWMKGYKNVSLDKDFIRTDDNQVLIIRIIEGQVGLITIQGVHHLLDVGTHVFNTGNVQYFGVVAYAGSNYFSHGPYHYLNVPRGKNAKVWAEVGSPDGGKSLVPRLIKEGEHFIRSTFFKFVSMVNMSDVYIGHDSIHILNVVKGYVAKANCDNLPRLFGEGLHIVESPNFSYEGMVDISKNLCISHGTITILQVPRGKIALLWNKNEPVLLDEPGLYEFNDENVNFVEFVDASERFIELGSKKVIQVYTGEVGITYDKGQLQILKNGRHVIDSSTHFFERFLSTKQRSIRLITYGANHKIAKSQQNTTNRHKKNDRQNTNDQYTNWNPDFNDDSDLLVCETKDLVKVGVRADVFYSIVDPDKCIQTLNTDELEDLVRETAVATLTNIIRSTALNQIAQSRQISASATEASVVAENITAVDDNGNPIEENNPEDSAVSYFFDRAHDEFMLKLHSDFVTRYGVDIANIRMESFKIMNTELANEIAQNCLTTAHVENQLSNLQGQNLIATQKEQTAADCEKIKASAEATSLQTRADAENKRRVEAAKAEAESSKFKMITAAQAEADAILLKAKAEAEAIRLKAAAEAERAKLLSQTTLGQQQCLFEIYADMIKASNSGVEKVVYLDPSINKDSPFTLGSLDGLNRDLHSISKLGIASESTSHPTTHSR